MYALQRFILTDYDFCNQKTSMISKTKTLYFLAILLLAGNNFSCKHDTPDIKNESDSTITAFDISNLKLSQNYYLSSNSTIEIKGLGFDQNDVIIFTPRDNQSAPINIPVSTINSDGITLKATNEFKNGVYKIVLKRAETHKQLGQSNFYFTFNPSIPDVSGKTIKGTVHSEGKGVANVIVSDGREVAKTDENGIYYLASKKETGYVFVSIPGNYELVNKKGNLPVFYQNVNAEANTVELIDFELTPTNNENHVVLSLADLHLANRTSDLAQFHNGFVKDANQIITYYQSQGKKVYGLTLGDLTWDAYWYSNSFMMPQYVKEIANINAPIFNVIGNHDNDPYIPNDWNSENAYRRTLGPTYYSFNLGKVHYVVLDDTEYLNNGGSLGVIGDRNYNGKITDQQLSWLAKDLENISANTPVIVATHIQIHNAPSEKGNLPTYRISNGDKLISLLNKFNEVHILTGHTHVNYRVPRDAKIMEHNTAAICATWWWTGNTGYAGNHISPDGSPGGYGVWEMNGNQIKWQYKAIGYDQEYQFRAYDLNNVHITAATYTPKATDEFKALVPKYASSFANANKNNEVLINVWGYDPNWKVSVTENGNSLNVERVMSLDPLHIISYGMLRLNANAEPTFDSSNTSHMFKVKANSANSTLEIKVTDRFGKVYTETMNRPKPFTTSMR